MRQARRRNGGQQPGVMRPRSVTGTSRRTPTDWLPRVLGARRPRVTSGPSALRLRCRSTSRLASVPETPNAEGRGCVRRRRTPAAGGWSRRYQRVEEKPLMFQGAPPRFDHGVREFQFRQGQDPAQHARGQQVVDWASTFSTPASANTAGVVSDGIAPGRLRQAPPHCSPAKTYQRAATPRSVERSGRSPRARRRESRRAGG